MTKEFAIMNAEQDMKMSQSDGFAIIRMGDDEKEKWKKLGYDVEYEYEVFTNFDELKDYVEGKHTYNFLDCSTYLRDGEKVVYVYSRSKIIIL